MRRVVFTTSLLIRLDIFLMIPRYSLQMFDNIYYDEQISASTCLKMSIAIDRFCASTCLKIFIGRCRRISWHCQSTAGGIGTTSPETNRETHSKNNIFPDFFGCVIKNITIPFQDILSIVSIEATSKKAKTSSMKLRGNKWQPW